MAGPIRFPSAREIRDKACMAAFGQPLISNIYRGLIAEIIVGAALSAEWRMCSADWRGWDFEHRDGCRLEVKQSAARQTWTAQRNPTCPIFDIRTKKGYFEGAEWIARAGRHAQIYVFAHHPITDETADHGAPQQWRFHVVTASHLPPAKTIRLSKIARLEDAITIRELGAAVEDMRATL